MVKAATSLQSGSNSAMLKNSCAACMQGECAPVPQALAMTLPDDAIIADGACVIRVLHAWLDMNAAANQEDHTLWVSRFVVQAARPAEDQQAAPLLSITGGAAWLAGLLLVGDGFEGRGVGITSGNVYIGGAADNYNILNGSGWEVPMVCPKITRQQGPFLGLHIRCAGNPKDCRRTLCVPCARPRRDEPAARCALVATATACMQTATSQASAASRAPRCGAAAAAPQCPWRGAASAATPRPRASAPPCLRTAATCSSPTAPLRRTARTTSRCKGGPCGRLTPLPPPSTCVPVASPLQPTLLCPL